MGSFVEHLCSPLLGSMRWANMKSKWKSFTKGVEGGRLGSGWMYKKKGGGWWLVFAPKTPKSTKPPQFNEKSPYEDLAVPPALD